MGICLQIPIYNILSMLIFSLFDKSIKLFFVFTIGLERTDFVDKDNVTFLTVVLNGLYNSYSCLPRALRK